MQIQHLENGNVSYEVNLDAPEDIQRTIQELQKYLPGPAKHRFTLHKPMSAMELEKHFADFLEKAEPGSGKQIDLTWRLYLQTRIVWGKRITIGSEIGKTLDPTYEQFDAEHHRDRNAPVIRRIEVWTEGNHWVSHIIEALRAIGTKIE